MGPKPWWEHLFEILAGLFAKQKMEAISGGGSGNSIGGKVTVAALPTFYSVEQERAMAADSLRALCLELVTDPALVSRDITGDGHPETFCNRAAQRAANAYGCHDLDGMRANQMVATLQASLGDWRRENGERAALHAQRGGLAFAAKAYEPNGHIALVAPEPCKLSGSWGKLVPVVANVGKTNGIMKTSQAFSVADGEPEYFVYREAP